MVDYLAHYAPVLNKAVEICNQLIAFFTSEQATKGDRLAKAALETENVRDGVLIRMTTPRYLAPDAFRSVTDFMAFYDNHATNDYGVSLPADKLAVRDRLLEAWIQEVVRPLVKLMNQVEEEVS